MPAALLATDSCFGTADQRHAPPARAAILKDLGYAGTTASLGDERSRQELPALLAELEGRQLLLGAVTVSADVGAGVIDPMLGETLRPLANRATLVELVLTSSTAYDKPSAPRADPRAADLINRVADVAGAAGLRLSLCPRSGCWLERIEDATRVLMRINRAEVGLTFNLFDWLFVDGLHLPARLELAIPRLSHVTINGAAYRGPRDCTIEPLGSGNVDLLELLGTLARLGYSGPLSLRGRGDVDAESYLRESMTAWRDMNVRLARAGGHGARR